MENETLIQTALSRLIADKTVLVIAHRMRTVAGADKIVVLSDGTVAEEGSPKDLEEKNGVYAHMVNCRQKARIGNLHKEGGSFWLPLSGCHDDAGVFPAACRQKVMCQNRRFGYVQVRSRGGYPVCP